MGKFKQEKTIYRRRVFVCSAFLLGLAIVLFSAGIVRAQTIPINGVLHRVIESNGDLKTQFEVVIGDDFVGSLPGSISDIIVRDPGGAEIARYSSSPSSWIYFPQWRDFFISLNGEPTKGVYSFEVISGGLNATDTDLQYVNRDLPIPDAATFSPANGAVVASRTPSFKWQLVDYPENIALYYRLEIEEDSGGGNYQRIFDTGRIRDLSFFTMPLDVLELNKNYRWRIRLDDSGIWEDIQNSSRSQWLYFTTPGSWAIDTSPPVLNPDSWDSVTWSTENGIGYLCSVKVIDLDGVSSGGFTADHPQSHSVQVTFPGSGGQTYNLTFDGAINPTSAYYYTYVDGIPPSGTYTFTVTGPDGNPKVFSEDLNSAPLPPIDKNSIRPTLKDESITATFDNVYVNYVNGPDNVLYDNFDSYGSIGDLDTITKWQPWHGSDVSIVGGALQSALLAGSIGRANGGLSFINPENISAIRADITINSISSDDGPPRARIAGYFFNNGNADVWANINVNGSRIFYNVDEEYINEQGTWQWSNPLASGNLLTGISPGATYSVSISWDGLQLNFSADDLSGAGPVTASYIPTTGSKFPPIDPSKSLQTRIQTFTSTSPTFSWSPVSGANRYRLRIYNHDNSATIWNGYSGEPTITVPPGILKPNSSYRYRVEAWDTHSPLNVDNVSKTPASNDDNYIFYTDRNEAQAPFITLENSGVRTTAYEFSGTKLTFWIEVHDAQGVPGDIKSVTVTHPGGTVEDLIYWGDNPYNPKTEISANYYGVSPLAPVDGGTYIFTVTDKDDHTFTLGEVLTVDPVGSIAASSMMPVNNAVVGGTEVAFDWADASGTTFYNLTIFDYDFNRLYDFYAFDSDPPNSYLNIPVYFFEPGRLYHWRINARREYFDENIDNMSLTPSSTWAMPVFAITAPADAEPGGGDGMPDYWEALHGLDPTLNDAGGDLDGDGLTNIEEFRKFTDPQNPDTDGDTIPDGSDVFPRSSSEWADSDGDGTGDNSDRCPFDALNDIDGDGVCGDVDNCPSSSNPDQMDTDGDYWGNACDNCPAAVNSSQQDDDGDGFGNVCDSCTSSFNPGALQTLDSDGDGVPDACDNCPNVANADQYDYNGENDGDGIGDACEIYKMSSDLTEPEAPPLELDPGEPLWDKICFRNTSASPMTLIRPDCANTVTRWLGPGGKPAVTRDRHIKAYGIPNDLITIEVGQEYCINCDIAQTIAPENLSPGATYEVDHLYTDLLQDRWVESAECGGESGEPCYTEKWIGYMKTEEQEVTVTEIPAPASLEADCSFNPDVWLVNWANIAGGPSITATVSGSGIDFNDLVANTVLLNGTVAPISSQIVGSNFILQFNRQAAVASFPDAATPRKVPTDHTG